MIIRSLSASSIKTYKKCAFAWYMNYHRKLDLGANFPASQGSLVHLAYQQRAEDVRDGTKNRPWTDLLLHGEVDSKSGRITPGYRGVDGIWSMPVESKKQTQMFTCKKLCNGCEFNKNGNCWINGIDIDKFDDCPKKRWKDAIWLTEQVLNDTSIKNPMTKKIIDVENRFELKIDDKNGGIIPVIGYMDIVTELDKDTVEVIDYKTGSHKMSYNECVKDPQLLIYNLAAHTEYPDYDNFLITIYYIRTRPITIAWEPNALKKTKERIRHYWNEIKSTESPERICDRRDGSVNFGWECKYMCNIEMCKQEHKKFAENGYKILPPDEIKVLGSDKKTN